MGDIWRGIGNNIRKGGGLGETCLADNLWPSSSLPPAWSVKEAGWMCACVTRVTGCVCDVCCRFIGNSKKRILPLQTPSNRHWLRLEATPADPLQQTSRKQQQHLRLVREEEEEQGHCVSRRSAAPYPATGAVVVRPMELAVCPCRQCRHVIERQRIIWVVRRTSLFATTVPAAVLHPSRSSTASSAAARITKEMLAVWLTVQ